MTRIMTFGAFDLLHYGHMRLLQRLSERGTYLIVALATDELIGMGKGLPFYPYAIRREMLLHTRYPNEVVPHGGQPDGVGRVRLVAGKIELVQHFEIDEVVMGDDWLGEYDFLKPYCRVSYEPRTLDISTTLIRRKAAIGG
ncbi:adenylyltransferase/cytidyltransferase family protein [Mesorhizobium marinum]|uniref:Adenylyltransferase/cytidyltransferase family protein n=1 Tax=Mesorhizobium marinum TaxID=3228790 RepID=A0ABV3QWE7_9HYPH